MVTYKAIKKDEEMEYKVNIFISDFTYIINKIYVTVPNIYSVKYKDFDKLFLDWDIIELIKLDTNILGSILGRKLDMEIISAVRDYKIRNILECSSQLNIY